MRKEVTYIRACLGVEDDGMDEKGGRNVVDSFEQI